MTDHGLYKKIILKSKNIDDTYNISPYTTFRDITIQVAKKIGLETYTTDNKEYFFSHPIPSANSDHYPEVMIATLDGIKLQIFEDNFYTNINNVFKIKLRQIKIIPSVKLHPSTSAHYQQMSLPEKKVIAESENILIFDRENKKITLKAKGKYDNSYADKHFPLENKTNFNIDEIADAVISLFKEEFEIND
ncbi:hypothetical protein JT31_01885 [Cedecea neteri]|uniref:Uncharacterized protein n=1 Tax=Cedecea neteri TaxID=158822 RepID=A0A089PZ01_9ENTR|nr:hypothetical protein [Cedecea neteri]AIR03414.1 hypothetical protein JT31_01885 [Cedecea neteri]